jgi:hypothetical protein
VSDEPSIDPQPGDIGDGMVEIRGATEITGQRGTRAVPGAPGEPSSHDRGATHGQPVRDLGGHRTEPLDPAAHLGSGGGSTTSDPGRVHPIIPGPPDLATSAPDPTEPPDLTTSPPEVSLPAADAGQADVEAVQEEFLAQAPAPLPPVGGPPAETRAGGSGSGRARGRAAAAAALLGAGASILAAIRRRRARASSDPARLSPAEAPAAVAAEAPARSPAPAAPPATSGPPADVEVSLTAGVTTDDDPTTLSADASRHLDLPQRRASEQAAREAAAEPPEGASNVSLTAGVVPPDHPADERR